MTEKASLRAEAKGMSPKPIRTDQKLLGHVVGRALPAPRAFAATSRYSPAVSFGFSAGNELRRRRCVSVGRCAAQHGLFVFS